MRSAGRRCWGKLIKCMVPMHLKNERGLTMKLTHLFQRLTWPHSSPLPRTRSRPLARPSRASGSAEFLSLLSQAAIVSSLRGAGAALGCSGVFRMSPSVPAALVQGFNARIHFGEFSPPGLRMSHMFFAGHRLVGGKPLPNMESPTHSSRFQNRPSSNR